VRIWFVALGAALTIFVWLCCGDTALAQDYVRYSQRSTSRLIHNAHYEADDIYRYHNYYDESSSFDDHCADRDLYDALSDRLDDALAQGDIDSAVKIGNALADLGEQIAADEAMAEWDYGGYDWCSCREFDYYFGPHEVDLSVQGGWMIQQAMIDDFSGRSTGGIFGVGATLMLPLHVLPSYLPNGYVFGKLSWYGTDTRTELFDKPGWRSRTNWLTTVDFGIGASIPNTPARLHVSFGPALASRTVMINNDSESKVGWGYSTDIGLTYKLSPRWGLTADWRWYHLQGQSFERVLGSDESLSQSGNMFLFGLNYRVGGSLK
jgi:opacity protein-like surface antigen